MKKLLCMVLCIIMVVSLCAIEVFAADVVITTSYGDSDEAERADGTYYDSSKSNAQSGGYYMSNNQYQTFVVEIPEDGDYELIYRARTHATRAAIKLTIDDTEVKTVEFDYYEPSGGSNETFYYLGNYAFTKGSHTLKFTAVTNEAVRSTTGFRLRKIGEIGEVTKVYSFAYQTDATGIVSTTANNAVLGYNVANWNALASNGWAQWELPEDLVAGWYDITVNARTNGSSPLNRTIGIFLGANKGAVKAGTENVNNNGVHNGEEVVTKEITNMPGTNAEYFVGKVYLDGSKRYFTIRNVGSNGTLYMNKFTLTPSIDRIGQNFNTIIDGFDVTSMAASSSWSYSNLLAGNKVMESNKWAGYRVNTVKTGMYKLTVCSTTGSSGNQPNMTLYVDNATMGTKAVPSVNSQVYANGPVWYVNLTEGEHVFRFHVDKATRLSNFTLQPAFETTVKNGDTKITSLGVLSDATLDITSDNDGEGIMIAVLYKNGNVEKSAVGTASNVSLAEVTTDDTAEYELKVFYWKDVENTLMPIGAWFSME